MLFPSPSFPRASLELVEAEVSELETRLEKVTTEEKRAQAQSPVRGGARRGQEMGDEETGNELESLRATCAMMVHNCSPSTGTRHTHTLKIWDSAPRLECQHW